MGDITDSFLYCWTDRRNNMLYVGIHKGSQHDGYICSSKLTLEQYNQRPHDFVRQIIASGTYNDMRSLETAILTSEDAARSTVYYNKHNNNGKYVNLNHSEDTKQKMSRAKTGKPIIKARGPRPHFAGTNNHFFGKTHTAQSRHIMSTKAKERSQGADNNNARAIQVGDNVYSTMKEATRELNVSMHVLRNMIRDGKARNI